MMKVTFPGGLAVDADCKGHTIHTDQPEKNGGGDTGPAPFDLFLASIATCAGLYALRFCEKRGFSADELSLTLEPVRDPEDKRVATIRIDVHLPQVFNYRWSGGSLSPAEASPQVQYAYDVPLPGKKLSFHQPLISSSAPNVTPAGSFWALQR